MSIGPSAAAERVQIMPVSKIRPGMTGYGLTVFSGFKIERFSVKVIAVAKNFLPKQDIILMKIDHPRLRKTGVVGGMSGSPIFLDGKLVGALAYGWRFAKEPITGVTPIENMLAMLSRKSRRPVGNPARKTVSAVDEHRGRRPVDRLTLESLSRRDRWWRPSLRSRHRPRSSTMLTPVSVPLNVAGFSSDTVRAMRDLLGDYGMEPVQGGGTGKIEGPTRFTAGGALGLRLVAGDMSMAGTGTVTWVKGNNVLAFGHSAFNAGEISVPVVSARINHTLASVARSFKLSSPARVLGALVQDRQPAIHADTSRRVSMVPLTLTMRARGFNRTFRAQLAKHRLLTGQLSSMVVASALKEAMADVDQATFRVRTRISAKGLPQLKIDEQRYSPAGVRQAAVFFSRGLAAVRQLLNNPFRPVELERIDVELDVDYNTHAVVVAGLQVSALSVDPGSRINLNVTFRPYGGAEFSKTYPLEIPPGLAGSVVRVEVAGGLSARPTLARPRNLRQYARNLRTLYPGRSVVVTLYTPSQGIKLSGRVISDLPESVIDSLNTGAKVRSERAFKAYNRRVVGTNRVVAGKKSIRIRVNSEDE